MYELIITNKNYSSWSMRAWVLLRHLGIPFTERLLPYSAAGFRQHTPSGRVPCLVDGDTRVCGPRMRRFVHGHVRPQRRCTAASWRCAMTAR